MADKGLYAPIQEFCQEEYYLVPNPDIRGTGDPYALQADWKAASTPVDPTRVSGSDSIISMASIPSPIIGKLIRLPDGSLAAPALSWQSEATSGLYRSTTNSFYWIIAGAQSQRWTSTGISLWGTVLLQETSGASPLTLSTSTPSAARLSITSTLNPEVEIRLVPTSNPIGLKASTETSESVFTVGFNTDSPRLRLDPLNNEPIDLIVSEVSTQSILTVAFTTASPTFKLDAAGGPEIEFALSTETALSVMTIGFNTSQSILRLPQAQIEMGNDRYLRWRDAADTQYLEMIGVNGADDLLIGLHCEDIHFYNDGITLQWTIEKTTGTLIPNLCAIGKTTSGDRVTELHSTLVYVYNSIGIGGITSLSAKCHITDSHSTTTPQIIANQASTGDAAMRLSLGTTISYIWGIDNSVSGDPFVLATAASGTAVLGTGNLLSITSGGLSTWSRSDSVATPTHDLIQSSTGDSALRFAIGSTTSFAVGIDNSDSDLFKISRAASGSAELGTGDLLTLSSTNLTLTAHLLFSADNTYDIGASGATRPRNGYFGSSVFASDSWLGHNGSVGFLATVTSTPLQFGIGSAVQWQISNLARFAALANYGFSHGTSALATNATEGFLFLQTCAGTPTGTPASIPSGQAPFILDTTNDRLYFYYDDGGGAAWHYIARTA